MGLYTDSFYLLFYYCATYVSVSVFSESYGLSPPLYGWFVYRFLFRGRVPVLPSVVASESYNEVPGFTFFIYRNK